MNLINGLFGTAYPKDSTVSYNWTEFEKDDFKLGNITAEDAQRLRRLTHKLYRHIYANYKEMEVLNEMTDESLMLDIDIILKEYEQKYKKEYEQKYQQKYEKEYEQKYQRMMEGERQALADQKAEIADTEAEIDRLKKLLQDAGISS